MSTYDGGDNVRGLPAYDAHALELGVPAAMDTPTFIEWTERQIETPEETAARVERRRERHREWHRNAGGIWSCCAFGIEP